MKVRDQIKVKKTAVAGKIKAVIFDMDGTLINSTEADYLAWEKIFNEFGESLPYDKYVNYLGIKSSELLKTKFHLRGEELRLALLRKLDYFKLIVEENGIETIPFATDLIHLLEQKGFRIALATSARKSKMEWVLKYLELSDRFEVIVSGDDVQAGKPDPAIFLMAAKLLEVDPEECLVFEDSVSGIKAANIAGMKTVAITTTQTAERLQEADMIIDSFDEFDTNFFNSEN